MAAATSVARDAFYALRRVAYGTYHAVAGLNYDRRWLATPKRTAAGRIHTYDPLNVHGTDDLLARLAAECSADDVVVDAGANVGVYALSLAADPGCRVAAFEPAPATADRLAANLAATDPPGDVSIHRVGLSDADGTATFHRSTYPELSSFNRYNASRWEAETRDAVDVPVRRLDSLVADGTVPPPDFLKVDVEGHGLELLRGARETLERHRPTVFVEPHPVDDGVVRTDELRGLFADRGYAVDDGDVWTARPHS